MPQFIVNIREVHVSAREVEADSVEHALELIRAGEGDEVSCEYSHTLSEDTWSVEDADGNEVREQYSHEIPGVPGS